MIGIFINLWNRLIGGGGAPAPTPALLDEYGGAAAAYSLRKLSSTYGGSAVRVRRASDNTEQDIGFDGDNLDETALMNFVGYQNLFTSSQTAIGSVVNTTSSNNVTTAPNGTNTAIGILETAATDVHLYYNDLTGITIGSSYTYSVYVKGNGRGIRVAGSVGFLSTYVVIDENGNVLDSLGNYSVIGVGNGWYRISLTQVVTATTIRILVYSMIGTNTTFLGDVTKGVYLWGFQLNVGTTAQPYQVTTSAARSGDGFVTKWYTQDSNGENLILQSQTFETASWTKTATTVSANSTTDPIGGSTAETLFEDNTNNNHYTYQPNNTLTAGTYTFSIYLKYLNRKYILVDINNGVNSGAGVVFDIELGSYVGNTVLGTGYTVQSYSISPQANGWYRYSVTVSTSGIAAGEVVLRNSNSLVWSSVYTGSTSVGVYIWGAQLSQGSWLQPYQVTTTTAILRRDASQSTAANQPRIVGGGVIERENGKAGVRFLGTSGMELKTSYSTPVGAAAFFSSARQYVAGGGIGGIIAADGGGGGIVYYSLSSPNGFVLDGSGVNLTNSASLAYNALSHMVLSGLYTSTTTGGTYLYSDGLLVSNYTATGVARISSLLSIGGRTGGSQPTRVFNGIIQEGLYYESNQLSNVLSIDRNLGGYYQTHWTGASSGLLDQFGGAAAAYSLRNLSSSYRGPLIRVRRSSDNAETDIGGTYNGDLDVASLVSFTGGQNLLLQSEDFTQSTWLKTNSAITANATIAPDGALTADKYTETAVNGQHALGQSYNIPASSSFTLSFYAKAAERSSIGISFYLNSSPFDVFSAQFNLITGSVLSSITNSAGVLISTSVQNVGNGWWRCSITGTTNKTGSHGAQIALIDSSFNGSYLGVAGSGVYIWGAQLNTGILQPYIPTTTTAVNGANGFVTKWYTQDNNYQNLVLQSQTFTDSNWVKSASTVTANVGVDPFGGNNATRWLSNIGSNSHYLAQSITMINGQSYTLSFYVKSNTGSNQLFRFFGSGSIFSPNLTATTDWQRVQFSFVANSSFAQSGILRPSGDLAVDLLVFGAQVNEGPVAQPYTATTTTVSQRRDAIQATAANQPRIVNAGGVESEGNRPAVFWTDGSGMRLTASFPAIPSPQTFFAVNRIGATSGIVGAALFDSYENVANAYAFTGSTDTPNNIYRYNAGASIDSSSNQIAVQTLTNIIHDTTSNVYNNELLTATGNAGTNSLSGLTIGHLRGNPTPIAAAYDWFGDIQELLVYPSNLATRLAVNSNINSYYRIYWQGNGTALLDSFSGASAAYSLRNLSSAYTGPLIRVRRSNDNVERDIYGTFGGDLDIASLVAFVGANSGFVTTWYDQSGNARNATQGTAANQPRIVNAGVVDTEGGKPAIFFDGTNDQLIHTIPNPSTATPYSVHAVVSSLTQIGYRGIFALGLNTTQGGMMILSRFTTSSNWGTYNNITSLDLPSTQSIQSAGIRLIEMYGAFSNGTYNFYTNGSSSGTYTSSGGQANNHIGGGQSGQEFNGDISEIIYYNADRTASRILIESNINNYYKIY